MEQIKLYKLLRYYFRYWLIVVGFVLAGLGLGAVYNNYIQKPSYRSDATLFVVGLDQPETKQDISLINNYIEFMNSRRVLEPVISELQLAKNYEQLVGSVSASNEKETSVIKLSVTSDNPETSKAIANSTVQSFRNQIRNLYGQENVRIVDGASLATTPFNVRKNLQLITAAATGFMLSIIVIFFMYDYRLSTGTLDKKKVKSPKRKRLSRLFKKRARKSKKATHKNRLARLFSRTKTKPTPVAAKKTRKPSAKRAKAKK